MLAHDPATLLGLDWTPVVVAIITVVGTFLNTALIVYVYSRVRPPSGGHPGKALEDTRDTAYATNAIVTMLAREHGIPVPESED